METICIKLKDWSEILIKDEQPDSSKEFPVLRELSLNHFSIQNFTMLFTDDCRIKNFSITLSHSFEDNKKSKKKIQESINHTTLINIEGKSKTKMNIVSIFLCSSFVFSIRLYLIVRQHNLQPIDPKLVDRVRKSKKWYAQRNRTFPPLNSN